MAYDVLAAAVFAAVLGGLHVAASGAWRCRMAAVLLGRAAGFLTVYNHTIYLDYRST